MNAAGKYQGGQPVIIGFLCNWCAYVAADGAGVARIQYPSGFRPVRVMCSGMVRPDLVMTAFECGADGVMIMGCRTGQCHYRNGNILAQARAQAVFAALDHMGISRERLCVEWISAAESRAFAQRITQFARRISNLGDMDR